MILPQSSAFVSLRARLSAVNSSGYTPPPAKSGYPGSVSSRSKIGKDEIKWQELLSRGYDLGQHVADGEQTSEQSRLAMSGPVGNCKR